MSTEKLARYPQLAKAPLLTKSLCENPTNRFWAKVIDLILVGLITFPFSFFWSWALWVGPFVLLPLFDLMGRGQSPGKWLMGLHTIEIYKGGVPSFYQSLVRNFPFILLLILLPSRQSWALLPLIPLLAWLILESYFVFKLKGGVRVGDILGNTRVCDYKDEHTKFIEQFLKEDNTPYRELEI